MPCLSRASLLFRVDTRLVGTAAEFQPHALRSASHNSSSHNETPLDSAGPGGHRGQRRSWAPHADFLASFSYVRCISAFDTFLQARSPSLDKPITCCPAIF
ncbi:hypothetical protein BD311DRAFT_747312 [Dichomitus squalens]|uniref:Uncharacterized protein n=1 Tax=Dichomitus squalens TaxID=114155 RepID=A0A4Q9N547_9APHY|nr:hypothetical protein BD311DRAFT_747312 [Dichomitus squalens]